MSSGSSVAQSLQQEQKSLTDGARLHWVHWMIIIASALLTLVAWHFSRSQLADKIRNQYEREATQVVELVSERLQKYEDALWSGVAAIHAGNLDYRRWNTFARTLRLETRYPGINGIGVILRLERENLEAHLQQQHLERPGYRIYPEHSAPELMPIVFIEPEATNAQAVGLDIAHEANRYEAAKRARNTGQAQITGPIVLVQDAGRTPGFLFYAPYYDAGYQVRADGGLSRPLERFVGMVYAPFVVKKLMEGTLEKARRQVGIRLSDGDSVLYDELVDGEANFDPSPMFKTRVEVPVYGRTWVFDIWSGRSFREATRSSQPAMILLGGILIDTLLLCIFLMLSRANRRALDFAGRMTHELKQKTSRLEETNEELERFAYITSHDLKTPLRGISHLTEFLREDLQDYMAAPGANPEIRRNLRRLDQRAVRMENLITGILSYSGLGARAELVESLDVAEFLNGLPDTLGVAPHQIVCEGELPVFDTRRVRLEQVLINLVDNAFKYHHDKNNASVTIACKAFEDHYEFSVRDDGPGIDPRFHARIFEVFQTLQPKDEVEGSGVGLAIVKKSVEGLGGKIRIVSEPGAGTCFRFTWPRFIQEVDDQHAA